MSDSLRPHGLYSSWNSLGQTTDQGKVAFPFSRGIFLTQESNLGLLHCRQILYQLSHKGSPGIVERVGEGNGTRLQYSCLEYPMDGGAC